MGDIRGGVGRLRSAFMTGPSMVLVLVLCHRSPFAGYMMVLVLGAVVILLFQLRYLYFKLIFLLFLCLGNK